MTQFHRQRLNARFRGSALLWLTAMVLVVPTGLLVYFVEQIAGRVLTGLTTGWDFFFAALLVATIIYVILWWQHDRIARQVSAVAEILDAAEITGRPYLICGYSPIRPNSDGTFPPPITLNFDAMHSDIALACAQDRSLLGPWQQNLRVLNTLKDIRHLYVICPEVDQFEQFSHTLRHFFTAEQLGIARVTDRHGNIAFRRGVKHVIPPDYEDFEYVTAGIDLALETICRDHGIGMDEAEAATVIDVTAGLKTFSIAAAIASLNRSLLFVYAGTGRNAGKVLAYNASIRLFGEVKM